MTDPAKITSASHGFERGEMTIISGLSVRWYKRLWRWLIRYKPPVYKIVRVDEDTFEIER